MLTTTTPAKTFTEPKKAPGIAGQYAISTTITYEGSQPSTLTFVSSVYGGPIIMVMESGTQIAVSDAGRFGGTLDADWVKAFLAAS